MLGIHVGGDDPGLWNKEEFGKLPNKIKIR